MVFAGPATMTTVPTTCQCRPRLDRVARNRLAFGVLARSTGTARQYLERAHSLELVAWRRKQYARRSYARCLRTLAPLVEIRSEPEWWRLIMLQEPAWANARSLFRNERTSGAPHVVAAWAVDWVSRVRGTHGQSRTHLLVSPPWFGALPGSTLIRVVPAL